MGRVILLGASGFVGKSFLEDAKLQKRAFRGFDSKACDLLDLESISNALGDIDEDGEIINITEFSSKLNSRYHEADVAFTKDKKTVYFSRNNYSDKKLSRDSKGKGLIQLYKANINSNGEWINVEPMPFNSNEYQTGHPTLSANEKTYHRVASELLF